jgi:hypothetical protein
MKKTKPAKTRKIVILTPESPNRKSEIVNRK